MPALIHRIALAGLVLALLLSAAAPVEGQADYDARKAVLLKRLEAALAADDTDAADQVRRELEALDPDAGPRREETGSDRRRQEPAARRTADPAPRPAGPPFPYPHDGSAADKKKGIEAAVGALVDRKTDARSKRFAAWYLHHYLEDDEVPARDKYGVAFSWRHHIPETTDQLRRLKHQLETIKSIFDRIEAEIGESSDRPLEADDSIRFHGLRYDPRTNALYHPRLGRVYDGPPPTVRMAVALGIDPGYTREYWNRAANGLYGLMAHENGRSGPWNALNRGATQIQRLMDGYPDRVGDVEARREQLRAAYHGSLRDADRELRKRGDAITEGARGWNRAYQATLFTKTLANETLAVLAEFEPTGAGKAIVASSQAIQAAIESIADGESWGYTVARTTIAGATASLGVKDGAGAVKIVMAEMAKAAVKVSPDIFKDASDRQGMTGPEAARLGLRFADEFANGTANELAKKYGLDRTTARKVMKVVANTLWKTQLSPRLTK